MRILVAEVTMASSAAQGRQGPIDLQGGYMPHLRVNDGEMLGVEFALDHAGEHWLAPGDTGRVQLKLFYEIDYSALVPGAEFAIVEGTRNVGHGVVLADAQ